MQVQLNMLLAKVDGALVCLHDASNDAGISADNVKTVMMQADRQWQAAFITNAVIFHQRLVARCISHDNVTLKLKMRPVSCQVAEMLPRTRDHQQQCYHAAGPGRCP
jgi:hypothetical protein